MAEVPDVFSFQDPIQSRICSEGKQQVGNNKVNWSEYEILSRIKPGAWKEHSLEMLNLVWLV